jgi:hypothetical protein
VSRMRAFRLSRTFFSCPEYVWRMNHCCMTIKFPYAPMSDWSWSMRNVKVRSTTHR